MSPRELYVAEPPPRYWVRPPIVLDCSVLAAALFEEEARENSQRQIAANELHAPYVLQSEIAHVALKKLAGGFEEIARAGLKDLQKISIDLHRIQEEPVFELAEKYKLSAYDASYLWLAGFLKAPLATYDQRLAKAARSHLAGLP